MCSAIFHVIIIHMVGEKEGVRNSKFQPLFPLILSKQHAYSSVGWGIRALGEKKGGMAIIKEWGRGWGSNPPEFSDIIGGQFFTFSPPAAYIVVPIPWYSWVLGFVRRHFPLMLKQMIGRLVRLLETPSYTHVVKKNQKSREKSHSTNRPIADIADAPLPARASSQIIARPFHQYANKVG